MWKKGYRESTCVLGSGSTSPITWQAPGGSTYTPYPRNRSAGVLPGTFRIWGTYSRALSHKGDDIYLFYLFKSRLKFLSPLRDYADADGQKEPACLCGPQHAKRDGDDNFVGSLLRSTYVVDTHLGNRSGTLFTGAQQKKKDPSPSACAMRIIPPIPCSSRRAGGPGFAAWAFMLSGYMPSQGLHYTRDPAMEGDVAARVRRRRGRRRSPNPLEPAQGSLGVVWLLWYCCPGQCHVSPRTHPG